MLRGRWLNKRANEKSFEVHFWSVALTFAIINSTIDNSKSGGVVMSSIDLVILGIVLEKPQSAYDIQKDVEYHHLSRWTKISVPSIYRKVLQLSDKGYLQSDIVKGDKLADKAIYSITDQGRAYFKELMASCAAGPWKTAMPGRCSVARTSPLVQRLPVRRSCCAPSVPLLG